MLNNVVNIRNVEFKNVINVEYMKYWNFALQRYWFDVRITVMVVVKNEGLFHLFSTLFDNIIKIFIVYMGKWACGLRIQSNVVSQHLEFM